MLFVSMNTLKRRDCRWFFCGMFYNINLNNRKRGLVNIKNTFEIDYSRWWRSLKGTLDFDRRQFYGLNRSATTAFSWGNFQPPGGVKGLKRTWHRKRSPTSGTHSQPKGSVFFLVDWHNRFLAICKKISCLHDNGSQRLHVRKIQLFRCPVTFLRWKHVSPKTVRHNTRITLSGLTITNLANFTFKQCYISFAQLLVSLVSLCKALHSLLYLDSLQHLQFLLSLRLRVWLWLQWFLIKETSPGLL